MQKLFKYKWIFFDMDDTLYPEIYFLKTAYNRIACFLHQSEGCNSDIIYKFLVDEFERGGRKNLFDRLFYEFKIDASYLDDLLHIMRATIVSPKIPLYSASEHLVSGLIKNNKKVVVITNGNVEQQKNKIKSILWNGLDRYLIFALANIYKPKPDIMIYEKFLKPEYGIDLSKAIMVGDSIVDEQFSANLNIPFVDINTIVRNKLT